jgi:hypothetical protein
MEIKEKEILKAQFFELLTNLSPKGIEYLQYHSVDITNSSYSYVNFKSSAVDMKLVMKVPTLAVRGKEFNRYMIIYSFFKELKNEYIMNLA